MSKVTGSLTGIANALGTLEGEFPFESRLSLAPLIRFWDEEAKDPSVCGEMARSLMTRVHQAPELLGPIDDLSVLDAHGELVDGSDGRGVPDGLRGNRHSCRALIPFKLRSFYATPSFDRT